jgi:hypothetical protein
LFPEIIMKFFVRAFVVAAAVAAPALSFAQEGGPAGQAGMLIAQSQPGNDAQSSGYGSAAGNKDQAESQQHKFSFLHRHASNATRDSCVGPNGYCITYFGS